MSNVERIGSTISPLDPWPALTKGLPMNDNAGNPSIVFHDGKLIRRFIARILSGGNVDVWCGSRLYRLGDPRPTTDDQGMPCVTGVVLDEEYEPTPMGKARRYTLEIPWESITKIEVF